MAMPTIVLQATTTKNDLVVPFALGCWLYAYERYRKTRKRIYLFLCALGLAFAVGSKTSAIPLCLICSLVMLYLLRREKISLLFFVGTYIPLLILFGSVETYALSYACFHNILGPPSFVQDHANRDGLRGGVANIIRYFFGNLSLGIEGANQQSGLSAFFARPCRYVLHFLGLTNVGYRSDFNDQNMRFVKFGVSAAADFGFPGAIAMVSSPLLLLRFRSAPVLAGICAAGLLSLAIVSLSIAWMEWNTRFLCLTFVLLGIAFSLFIFANPSRNRVFCALIEFLVIWSALSLPFLTKYEGPADLSAPFRNRRKLEFSEYSDLRTVYERVFLLKSNASNTPWFLVAGEDSWTLPFMTLGHFVWRSAPQWSEIAEWEKNNPGKAAYILALQRPDRSQLPADVVNVYPLVALILKIPASAH
jgi:hypothetical protein